MARTKCKICGKELPYKRKTYCSRSCMAEDYRKLLSGRNNRMWEGGRVICSNGYVEVYAPWHPNRNKLNRVGEHRLLMEEYLGRFLDEDEVVHHENGDVSDNRIENLKLFKNQSEHISPHMREIASSKQRDSSGKFI